MTREEAKKLLPIIEAYAKGKVIESRYIKGDKSLWYDEDEPSFDDVDDFEYRIKPEQKYRPFKDSEECWNEMQKHQPFGWVKDGDGSKFTIGTMASSDGSIFVSDEGAFYLGEMFEKFKFADGTPFGIKEEE
mgnify:CR=1 FL=1